MKCLPAFLALAVILMASAALTAKTVPHPEIPASELQDTLRME